MDTWHTLLHNIGSDKTFPSYKCSHLTKLFPNYSFRRGKFIETQQLVAVELILPLAAVKLRLKLRLKLSELVEDADYLGLDFKWWKRYSIVSYN